MSVELVDKHLSAHIKIHTKTRSSLTSTSPEWSSEWPGGGGGGGALIMELSEQNKASVSNSVQTHTDQSTAAYYLFIHTAFFPRTILKDLFQCRADLLTYEITN